MQGLVRWNGTRAARLAAQQRLRTDDAGDTTPIAIIARYALKRARPSADISGGKSTWPEATVEYRVGDDRRVLGIPLMTLAINVRVAPSPGAVGTVRPAASASSGIMILAYDTSSSTPCRTSCSTLMESSCTR